MVGHSDSPTVCIYICTGRTSLVSGGGGVCIGDSVSRKAQRYVLHAARIARSCDSTPSALRRVVETEGTARIETNPFPNKKSNTRSRRTVFTHCACLAVLSFTCVRTHYSKHEYSVNGSSVYASCFESHVRNAGRAIMVERLERVIVRTCRFSQALRHCVART